MKSPRFTCVIGTLTSLAYMLSLLLPFMASYGPISPRSDDSLIAALTGGKVLICTINGYELVSIGDVEENGHTPNSDFACGLCVLAANGLNLASFHAPPSLDLLNQAAILHAGSPDYLSPLASYYHSNARPRAPPVA